jgi:hypothetical protein
MGGSGIIAILSVRKIGLCDRGLFQHETLGSPDDYADACHPFASKAAS